MTTIVYFFRKCKCVKYSLYAILFILLFLFLFLKFSFGTNISPLVVTMAFETNAKESGEFIRNYLYSKWTFLSIFAIIVIIIFIVISRKNRFLNNKNIINAIALIVITSFIVSIYTSRIFVSLLRCENMKDVSLWYDNYYPYAMDNLSILFYSIYIPSITVNEVQSVVVNTQKAVRSEPICTEPDSLDVVLIIGESFIKRHAQIYGYYLHTTPNMCEEQEKGRLYVFQDMISPYNSTTQSIKSIMCSNSISEGEGKPALMPGAN